MTLALLGRDERALEAVAAQCQEGASGVGVFAGDLSDEVFRRDVFPDIQQQLGAIHALVNNAGMLDFAAADQADMTTWDRMLDVNFRSWVHLTNYALPHLLEHHESAVINLCSVAGRETFAGGAMYTATKHAVHAWARCMFDDLSARGLKVCTIYPGYVDTEMVTFVANRETEISKGVSGPVARNNCLNHTNTTIVFVRHFGFCFLSRFC
jgi:NADP-dependent 3-hydroxy acid dehydrogenase YdfG